MVYSVGGFLKIRLSGRIDIGKYLRISIDDRKPGALDLDQNFVAFEECVAFVPEIEFQVSHFIGHKRFRLFETVPVFTPEDFSCQKPPIFTFWGLGFGFGASPG